MRKPGSAVILLLNLQVARSLSTVSLRVRQERAIKLSLGAKALTLSPTTMAESLATRPLRWMYLRFWKLPSYCRDTKLTTDDRIGEHSAAAPDEYRRTRLMVLARLLDHPEGRLPSGTLRSFLFYHLPDHSGSSSTVQGADLRTRRNPNR